MCVKSNLSKYRKLIVGQNFQNFGRLYLTQFLSMEIFKPISGILLSFTFRCAGVRRCNLNVKAVIGWNVTKVRNSSFWHLYKISPKFHLYQLLAISLSFVRIWKIIKVYQACFLLNFDVLHVSVPLLDQKLHSKYLPA